MKISFALACLFGFVVSNKVDSFFQYGGKNQNVNDSDNIVAPVSNATAVYKNMTGVAYDVDMNCENCVRSGFDYCIFRTFPNQTTHGQFSNCS